MIAFLLGVFMGYLLGKSLAKKVTYTTINMTAEEAMDLVESEEALKKLKKEMKW